MKKEERECDRCGEVRECEQTKLGLWFCSYECMQDYYGGIPEEEDFLSAKI